MKLIDEDQTQDFDPTANAWYTPPVTSESQPAEPFVQPQLSRSQQIHKISLMLHQADETPSAEVESRNVLDANQRQFSRCPISAEQTSGILNLNSRSFNCRLVELSIGGFGVVIAGKPKFTLGTVGNLRAPGLNYVVSVTRQQERADGVYVGLKQVEEIMDYQRRPGDPSPLAGYLVAGLSGAFIATVSYYFMYGS